MIYTISNEVIEVSVKSKGAELCNLKASGSNREYMWQAEKPFWERQSPTLFPSIGKSLGDIYKYKGDSYNMPKHGFVRDVDFECEKVDSSTLIFTYKHCDATWVHFPFEFELKVKYHISHVLEVSYEIINHSKMEMPFSLGGHPAFNWNFDERAKLSFDVSAVKYYPVLAEGIGQGQDMILEDLVLRTDVFENDALIYEGIGSVKYENGDYNLEMTCSDFRYIGIWSQVGAPFVCFEPWTSLPDQVGHNQDIMAKEGIIVLGPSENHVLSYTLKIA